MSVTVEDLQSRLEKYTSVLQIAEQEENISKVRRYKRIVKQYESAIQLCEKGRPVPIDELPNPPGFEPLVSNLLNVADDGNRLRTPSVSPRPSPTSSPRPSPRPSPNLPRREAPPVPPPRDLELPSSSDLSDTSLLSRIQVPIRINDDEEAVISDESSIQDALNARLKIYNSVMESAEAEGNTSKARRYKRIIKQYADAIAHDKAGRPVELGELPNPPGFPPLVPVSSRPPSPVPEKKEATAEDMEPAEETKSIPAIPKLVMTRAEKQTTLLKKRQQEYRDAAVAAKKAGQIEEAKEYLKIFKGFDRLIQASESGLPVDMSTIPVSLKEKAKVEEDFYLVSDKDFKDSSDSEVYEMLEKKLSEQIDLCLSKKSAAQSSQDIANSNKYEQYELQFKKDLNYVKACHASSYAVPKFHYENKSFSIFKCNSDLTDNDVEVKIIKGLSYNVSNPNDVDTYVTYEFPYPADKKPTGRTDTVKNTNNPSYNTKVNFQIHRDVKACLRIFRRAGLKLEVWSKGGFLRSDISLGTVVVKLSPLETDTTIHDAFPLMNGRRPAGGTLEVKIRVRFPLGSKKIENVSEHWLVIDY